MDRDQDLRPRRVGVGVAVVVGEGLVGGTRHADRVAVRLEESLEPPGHVEGLFFLLETVPRVHGPDVGPPVARVDDHLAPATGLLRPGACGEEGRKGEE